MATLVLRNVKGSPLTNTEVDNNFSNINNELGIVSNLNTAAKANLVSAINEVSTRTGNVSDLNTSTTSNLVSAINEVSTRTGNVSNLNTSTTSNLVSAINEVFTRATSNVYATNVTVTGNITISGNAVLTTTPTANTHIVNKVYVDSQKTISNVAPVSVGSTSSGHVWYIY